MKPIKGISLSAGVSIEAASAESKGPRTFQSEFYTGGALNIAGWDLPVVVDLAGLKRGNVLVANLDHDKSKRVGNFDVTNDGKTLVATGKATAKTAARDEVIGSADEGYQWQASIEVNPEKVEHVKDGKTVNVNGQSFTGPLYITRFGTLKGFAFVSHGADDNTTVSIAASAASKKETTMKTEVLAWLKETVPSLDPDSLSPEQIERIEADYAGKTDNSKKNKVKAKFDEGFDAKRSEMQRVEAITEIALAACDRRPYDIDSIKELAQTAIEGKWTVEKFRLELLEASLPPAHTVFRTKRDEKLSERVLTAAVCEAGRLPNLDKHFTDQELQTAHDKFKSGIGLGQLLCIAAESNGYRGSNGGRVDLEVQRAAFGMQNGRNIHANFSTIDISNIVAATANKFMHEGWMAVDLTPLRIAAIRNVKNFQQITTVSLTGHLQYGKIGSDGELKHGTLADLTYTNQADTYGTMLAITRKDLINDDLGALTAVPRRLGRGGALKLNDIFWTEFLGLVGASFFASGNNNINTAVADMTIGGLAATETIFMNQTDPDGKPLGIMPKIVLVPPALRAAATALCSNQPGSQVLITGASSTIPAANVFAGRFQIESSPYISNSSYTGYTSVGWWMLADPNECPVIEIAALNGRVEPTVETAEAEFNVLGIQMRGYSDIGVNEQEKRGGVYADGGAS